MTVRIIGKSGVGASVVYTNNEPERQDIIWADTSLVDTGGNTIFKIFDSSPHVNDWVVISYTGGDAVFATSIIATPYGDIKTTNVQDQIRELEDNKAKLINGVIPLSQIPDSLKESFVVEDITERDSIPAPYVGMRVFVIDATEDTSVETGGAEYIFFNNDWRKISEIESMDVIISWNNVTNKPDVFIKDIDTSDEVKEGSINLFYTDERVADYLQDVLKDTDSVQVLMDSITKDIGFKVNVDNETIEINPNDGIRVKFNDTEVTDSNIWSAKKIKEEIENATFSLEWDDFEL